nr:MAG TPA: hypothetical protein [Caudoviricetes sp.]
MCENFRKRGDTGKGTHRLLHDKNNIKIGGIV